MVITHHFFLLLSTTKMSTVTGYHALRAPLLLSLASQITAIFPTFTQIMVMPFRQLLVNNFMEKYLRNTELRLQPVGPKYLLNFLSAVYILYVLGRIHYTYYGRRCHYSSPNTRVPRLEHESQFPDTKFGIRGWICWPGELLL